VQNRHRHSSHLPHILHLQSAKSSLRCQFLHPHRHQKEAHLSFRQKLPLPQHLPLIHHLNLFLKNLRLLPPSLMSLYCLRLILHCLLPCCCHRHQKHFYFLPLLFHLPQLLRLRPLLLPGRFHLLLLLPHSSRRQTGTWRIPLFQAE